jgi:hypothetical protein
MQPSTIRILESPMRFDHLYQVGSLLLPENITQLQQTPIYPPAQLDLLIKASPDCHHRLDIHLYLLKLAHLERVNLSTRIL